LGGDPQREAAGINCFVQVSFTQSYLGLFGRDGVRSFYEQARWPKFFLVRPKIYLEGKSQMVTLVIIVQIKSNLESKLL
jgi:hypothetical protein